MGLSAFYETRHGKIKAFQDSNETLAPPTNLKRVNIHAVPAMEFVGDDNYQVRMLCGATAHSHPLSVSEAQLRCAMRNLLDSYVIVGIQERFNESLCLITKHLGLPYDEVRS